MLAWHKDIKQQRKLQTSLEEVPGVVLQHSIPGVTVYNIKREVTQEQQMCLHHKIINPLRPTERHIRAFQRTCPKYFFCLQTFIVNSTRNVYKRQSTLDVVKKIV